MNDNFLPLDLCQVLKCAVRLLYEDGIHHFDLIMLGFSRFHHLDGDGLEARFQAKRARSQGIRWDYSVMHRTSKFLAYLQEPNFSKRISSSCLPEDATPKWFSNQSWRFTVTCQLSSHWANNEFLGFCLCAVIASDSFNFELQVKCTYHFRNEHGDSHDLYRYLYDEFDERAHQLRKHSYEI
uniref:C-JID domain-containing protein n=1 Tax=Populus alba TaxID=43335 RepID=A0A4U5NNK8_POPAL|nr:hypothetical protein D5086_0000257420 [Populus alba]